jgi:hypothetical protein
MTYINTGMANDAGGSDCIASSPGEAVAMAMAQMAELAGDVEPGGSSAGDQIDLPDPYTPA